MFVFCLFFIYLAQEVKVDIWYLTNMVRVWGENSNYTRHRRDKDKLKVLKYGYNYNLINLYK